MKAFGMRGPPIEVLITETLYFLILFALCAIIYYKTKPIYDLTKHKGIFFFRNIFFFFGLTYLFRLFHMFIIFSHDTIMVPKEIILVSLLLVGYFSTMAILCLVIVAVVKNMKKNIYFTLFWMSLISIIISALTFGRWAHQVLILIHGILLLFAVLYVYMDCQKKKTKTFMSYNKLNFFLLFIFWLLNVITFTRGLVPQDLRIPMYIFNIAIFFWVFLRVHKRVPSVKKKR